MSGEAGQFVRPVSIVPEQDFDNPTPTGKGNVVKTETIPAGPRKTFNMAADIGAADASIKVTSNVAVIPERAMYRNNRREGHDSIGTTTPANDYYLAEGTTGWGFTTYVLVQNPQAQVEQLIFTDPLK